MPGVSFESHFLRMNKSVGYVKYRIALGNLMNIAGSEHSISLIFPWTLSALCDGVGRGSSKKHGHSSTPLYHDACIRHSLRRQSHQHSPRLALPSFILCLYAPPTCCVPYSLSGHSQFSLYRCFRCFQINHSLSLSCLSLPILFYSIKIISRALKGHHADDVLITKLANKL